MLKKIVALVLFTCLLMSMPLTVYAENGLCQAIFSSRPALKSLPRTSMAALNRSIDRLAAQLKSEGLLTSPIEWRKRGAADGLTKIDLPVSAGGLNLSTVKTAELFEHAGRYALDLRDSIGGGHVRPLAKDPNSYQQSILKQVGDGKGYVAIAITEKEAGSNHQAMKSVSEKTEGGYLLTGEKMYNARLTTASHVVLFTRAGSAGSKLNAFVLPINYPGLRFTELDAHGLKGNSFGGVAFEKLFIPESFRIGAEGEGSKVFREHFLYWRLMMSAAAIGTGKGALEQLASRMRERQAFGGPIGRFTHLQQPLAEHTAKLHMASLLVKEASKKIDQGKFDEASSLVSMAKAEGVEWALKASDFAMEVFGAEGYSHNVDLAQRVADLQGLRIADGTTHIMRQDVVRKVYGEDFWQLAIGAGG